MTAGGATDSHASSYRAAGGHCTGNEDGTDCQDSRISGVVEWWWKGAGIGGYMSRASKGWNGPPRLYTCARASHRRLDQPLGAIMLLDQASNQVWVRLTIPTGRIALLQGGPRAPG